MDHQDERFARYAELQAYIGWTSDDAARVAAVAGLLEPALKPIVDDFYEAIEGNEQTRRVITGGPAQIERLKNTLVVWLRELLSGLYDAAYVERRWRVGYRHVEIGLDQVFTNVALSRIRVGLLRALQSFWVDDLSLLEETSCSLVKLLDLDLAIIDGAYQAEHLLRQQRVERLATIGQVAGGVAHELRNPLNVVKTSVYYLSNARQASDEKRTEHLARIERHVDLADGVITALSSFAKLPVPDARAFDVAACVREALEMSAIPPAVEVVLELPEGLPAAHADDRQILIVLSNLMRNARDAMPRGGRLTVSAEHVGEEVAVRVTDNGSGIDAEDLARILEPLYTTKARGLGLGLAISRSILDKNRGSLHVVSEPGKGSAFTVRLPAESAPAGQEKKR